MGSYLVTGGAGFIGSHIAVRLIQESHRVRVLDNLSTGRRENLDVIRGVAKGGAFEFLEGDIRDPETCRDACRDVEYVLHQAALASVPRSIERPADTTAVNVCGFVNVLAAAREQGVRRVVAASSSSVYGDTPTLPKHEGMVPAPLSPYAVSKLAGEQFARVFSTTLGLETISLRYFNVFGPRQDPQSQYAAVIPLFATWLRESRPPRIYGDGEQSRDFTYIDNVVDANLAACTQGKGDGQAINIACGERYTLLALLEAMGRHFGVRPEPEFLPPRPGDVRHSQASIERAGAELGFSPRVGFEEGLKRTVEHFRRAA
ncbi:MAG TPA: SDR family oxidoreductase [Candidatus Polarisedimenticolia bacterium]|nr:SDR family oxidoreductase [Candidatus Polarisedimenticolia bacterium]